MAVKLTFKNWFFVQSSPFFLKDFKESKQKILIFNQFYFFVQIAVRIAVDYYFSIYFTIQTT